VTATPAEQQIRRQQWIVLGLTVVVAATRFLPLARSMWDWDEALFSLALHDYNVAAHHPHPPGFPLYIGLGRFLRAFVIHDDFRALRTIQLLASMCVFPVMYALGRAMRFTFSVAVSGALLFAFLPNVWAFGGTAFSDIFNIVLLMAGLALLQGSFRAQRGINGVTADDFAPPAASQETPAFPDRKFLIGTAIFSLSLLVRPQNVLCAYPWFAGAWPRIRARRYAAVAAAAMLSIAVVAIGYGIAAKATGWHDYITAVRSHQHYVATVDGYENPNRPPSVELFPEVVIDPFEAGKASLVMFIFAVVGLLFAEKAEVEALATFFPFLAFALFMLNPQYAARLSIGFMPLLALLAASGIERISTRAARLVRRPHIGVVIQTLCVLALAGRYATWLAPALREGHRTDSPPVQAMRWVRDNVPRSGNLIIHAGFGPMAEYYLGGYSRRFVDSEAEVRKLPPMRNTWYVGDGASSEAAAVNFRRSRKRLFAIFDRRYFEANVRPLTGAIRYVDGWYDEESSGDQVWRWMRSRGMLILESIPAGGELRFTAFFPIDHEAPPEVIVTIDGAEAGRFIANKAVMSCAYRVPPSAAGHEVVFTVSSVVNPARQHFAADSRDLGMQIRTISWQP
jgi:hypothetical protein